MLIKTTPEEISALVAPLQGQKLLQKLEDCVWPPMSRILINQGGFGGGGSGNYTDVRCSIRIDDFKSAVEALSDIKACLERICSLIEDGGVSLSIKGK